MTDREMLELAAKAAGLNLDQNSPNTRYRQKTEVLPEWVYWNPLRDDGDCARLESELDIDVRWGQDCYGTDGVVERIGVMCGDYHGTLNAVEPYGADKQAARRLASTKVAAMIGKDMP